MGRVHSSRVRSACRAARRRSAAANAVSSDVKSPRPIAHVKFASSRSTAVSAFLVALRWGRASAVRAYGSKGLPFGWPGQGRDAAAGSSTQWDPAAIVAHGTRVRTCVRMGLRRSGGSAIFPRRSPRGSSRAASCGPGYANNHEAGLLAYPTGCPPGARALVEQSCVCSLPLCTRRTYALPSGWCPCRSHRTAPAFRALAPHGRGCRRPLRHGPCLWDRSAVRVHADTLHLTGRCLLGLCTPLRGHTRDA